ncbi:MAG: hypothetical protein EVA89_34830 [Sandaracinaceae bacterium]|nr:MAG: hypothetical protein EVA89_34830 [Sandaracinaceae bacterium]
MIVTKLRKVESESEARRLLARVKGSGLPLKEWAQAHGVHGRSLNAWKNLARRGLGAEQAEAPLPTQLVELVPAKASASPARCTVRVGVAAVEFGDDFEPETLRSGGGLGRGLGGGLGLGLGPGLGGGPGLGLGRGGGSGSGSGLGLGLGRGGGCGLGAGHGLRRGPRLGLASGASRTATHDASARVSQPRGRPRPPPP